MKPSLYHYVDTRDGARYYEWYDDFNGKLHTISVTLTPTTVNIKTKVSPGILHNKLNARELCEDITPKQESFGIEYIRVLADAINNEN